MICGDDLFGNEINLEYVQIVKVKYFIGTKHFICKNICLTFH
jgi:hypothetical protein